MKHKYNLVALLVLLPLIVFFSGKEYTSTPIDTASSIIETEAEHYTILNESHTELMLDSDDFGNLLLKSSEGEVLKKISDDEIILKGGISKTKLSLNSLPQNKSISILGNALGDQPLEIEINKDLYSNKSIFMDASRITVLGSIESKEEIQLLNTSAKNKISTISIEATLNAPKVILEAKDTLFINEEIVSKGGNIQLLSSNVVYIQENALVNGSGINGGGTIFIGGDYKGEGSVTNAQKTYIHPEAIITADALENGDGGRIIVWADDFTQVYGNLSAKGINKGGFIETSGKVNLDVRTSPDVSAKSGKGGEWLLDPRNIDIVAGGGNVNITSTSPFNPTADNAQLGVNLITTALGVGNVTINTNTGGAQAGNINVLVDINYHLNGVGNTLTLNAEGDINLSGNIFDSTTGDFESISVVLNANGNITGSTTDITTGGGITNVLTLNAGGSIEVNSLNVSADFGGAITLIAGGDVTINSGILSANAGSSGSGGVNITTTGGGNLNSGLPILNIAATGDSGGNIVLNIDGNISATTLNLTSNGGAGGGDVDVTVNGINPVSIGTLDVSGTSGGGSVTFDVGGDLTITSTFETDISVGGPANDINITTGGNVTFSGAVTAEGESGGNIIITAVGSINTQSLSASGFSGSGGTIDLQSTGSTITTGDLSVTGTPGGGGNILIDADGNINVQDLDNSSTSGFSGSNGDITITANNGNVDIVNITTEKNGAGDGNAGNISVNTNSGDITVSGTFAISGNGGVPSVGGGATLVTFAGNVTAGDIISTGSGLGGGGSAFTIAGDVLNLGNVRSQAADVNLQSYTGDITAASIRTNSASGNGGNLTINSANDIINTSTTAYNASGSGTADGGTITINGNNLSLNSGTIQSSAGMNGGIIDIDLLGGISTTGPTINFAVNGDISGNIDLLTEGIISQPLSFNTSGTTASGNITAIFNSNTPITINTINMIGSNSSGNFAMSSVGNLIFNTNIITGDDANSFVGGSVNIDSEGDITFGGGFGINTRGLFQGGLVDILANGNIVIPGGVNSSVPGGGGAGDISIISVLGRVSTGFIAAVGQGGANGGNIYLGSGFGGNGIEITSNSTAFGGDNGSILSFATGGGANRSIDIVHNGSFSANLGGTPTFNGTLGPVIADAGVGPDRLDIGAVASPYGSSLITMGQPGPITSAATGDWSVPGTWSCTCVPTILDDVTIAAIHTVTADAGSAPTVQTLTINGTLNNNPNAETVTITNNLDITGGTFNNDGDLFLGGNLSISAGGVLFKGNLSPSILSIDGDVNTVGGTFNTPLSTNIFGGVNQTLSFGAGNLGEMVLTNGGTKTLTTNVTAEIGVTIEAGTTFNGGTNAITNGGWTQNGVFIAGTSSVIMEGTSTIDGTAIPDVLFNNLIINTGATTTLTKPIRVLGELKIINTLTAGIDDIILEGDFTMGAGATFNAGTSTVIFQGTTEQFINITDPGITDFYNLEINNTAASPNDRVNINGTGSIGLINQLTLTVGNLFHLTGAPGIYFDNTTLPVIGGSPTSMIDGELVRNASIGTPYTFPIGKNGTYAPIVVNQQSGSTIYAEYFDTPAADLTPDDATVDAVSPNEYWILTYGGPPSTAIITIPYDDTYRESDIIDNGNLALVDFSGGTWTQVAGGSTPTGSNTSGNVSSDAAVTIPAPGLTITFGNVVGGLNFQKVWTNGAGNNSWNDPSNWSPFGVPSTGDDVFFTNLYTANCTFNDNVNVNSINILSGYTGTITHVNGFNITVATDFIMADGTFIGATATSGNIDITGNFNLIAGSFTSTFFDLSIGGVFNFTGGSFDRSVGNVATVIFNGAAQTIPEVAFNNLTLQGSGTKTYAGLTDLVVDATLDIGAGVTLDANGQNLIIDINLFAANTSSITNMATVIFSGTSGTQFVDLGAGTLTLADVDLNNSDGLQLSNGILSITNDLKITNGIIDTQTFGGTLQIGSGATLTNFGPTHYVDGPLTKQGTDPFTFPVGKSGIYAPIVMTAPSIADDITVQYFQADAGGVAGVGVDLLSAFEYWEISGSFGSTANFTFDYNDVAPRLSGVSDEARLVITQYNGSTDFDAIGTSGPGSGNPTGIISTGLISVPTGINNQFTFGNAYGGNNTFGPPASITDYYWVGSADTDWNNANNWSYTTGGVGGLYGTPISTSSVIFNAGSLNDCDLNSDAEVVNFTSDIGAADFTLLSSFNLKVTGKFIQNAGVISIDPTAKLTLSNDATVIGLDFIVDGILEFDGISTLDNTDVNPVVVSNLDVTGEVTIEDNVLIDTQLNLSGNVNTLANTYLVVGDDPTPATFINGGGFVDGNFAYYVNTTGTYQFPFKDKFITLDITNVTTPGDITIRFDPTNPNPITEFVDNGTPITTLFAEGTFRLESFTADVDYNATISPTGFSTFPVGGDTRLVTRNNGTTTWQAVGVANGETGRDGFSLATGEIKFHGLANSCTDITFSPALFESESKLIACTFDELTFTLLGVDPDPAKKQFYRFYDINDTIIDASFEQDSEQANKFKPLNESILGQEFYVTIANENGCESPTERTPITLELTPAVTTPVLVNTTAPQICETNTLEIALSSTLQTGESYVLLNGETPVSFELTTDGNLQITQTELDQVAYNENGRFIGEYQLSVETELGCTSNPISVPFELTQLPVVTSTQAEQTLEVCEGEQITLAVGGSLFERQTYRIGIDNDDDGVSDEFVTESFQLGTTTGDEANFTRLLEPGQYTFYVSIEDTQFGCSSVDQLKIQYIVHANPENPVVGQDSKLIVCQGETIEVALPSLIGQEEYRWYTTDDRQNSAPFLTGNQQRFELQTFINIDSDINKGFLYVETYDAATSCTSGLIPVEYTVLKRPDQPETPEHITICQGEVIDNLLNNGTLETPENVGFITQEYRIIKGATQIYRSNISTYAYSPTENEFSGSFDVSIIRVYQMEGETFECESFPKSVPFTVNARTKIASVTTLAASCDEGGTLQVTIELPKDTDGNSIVRSHDLIITQLLEDGTKGTPLTRTRTPDLNGLIELPELAIGEYTLQVNQTNNVNDDGVACGLEEELSFTIEAPKSPKIITEQPNITWECSVGDFTGIEVDLGAARFVTYQWYKGEDFSQPIGTNSADLLNVEAGIYRLVISAGGNNINCLRDSATFKMEAQGNACETEINEQEVSNLCTLKNSFPVEVQTALGWPSCDVPNNNPEDWKGVGFDVNGKVVSLDLSELGLKAINKEAVTNFEQLIILNVSKNQLSFEDLEEIDPLVADVIADGQEPVGEELEEVTNVNQDITLSVPSGVTGARGTVTWVFVPVGESRENGRVVGTGSEITLENVTPQENEGTYYAEISHPDFDGLVILSRDIDVVITEQMIESDKNAIRDVLTELINSLGLGNNGRNSLEFDPEEPAASWPGVTQELDRCVGLDLSGFNLKGKIPEKIGELTALRRLSFFDNQLEGELPESIGNLTDLTYLDLDKNNLSGPVPQSITNLTKLKTLWLSRNAFTSLPESMGNLSELEYLLLQSNQFTEIPTSLGSLNQLRALDISGNKLASFISNVNLSRLERLNLSNNLLRNFELNIRSLNLLNDLDLSDNNLESLPSGVTASSSLKRLVVRRNLLNFADLEPINLSITEYSPQKRQEGDQEISVLIDASTSLAANIGGSQNQYVWYKDGVPLFQAAQASETYEIAAMNTSDAGEYICLVTNPLVPDLTLESRIITLSADCGAILEATISTSGNNNFCGNDNIFVQLKTNSSTDLTYTWFKDGVPLTLANDSIYNAFEVGTYTVRVQATSGCTETSAEVKITQSPLIDISIEKTGDLTLSATTDGNSDDIVWLRNGTDEVGTGSTFTATQEGLYQAIIKNENGCISESEPELLSITALADEFETGPLSVYPNPAQERVNIKFPKQQKEVSLTLRNIDGKLVSFIKKQSSNEVSINLQGLPRGMYLLEIQSEQGQVLKKVMKR